MLKIRRAGGIVPNTRANRKVCPYTVERYYTGLSALFNWSVNEGILETNSLAKIKLSRAEKKIVKALDSTEVKCDLFMKPIFPSTYFSILKKSPHF